MRDTFSVILGEQLVNTEQGKAASTFPTFYALDMVRFGLKKNILISKIGYSVYLQ